MARPNPSKHDPEFNPTYLGDIPQEEGRLGDGYDNPGVQTDPEGDLHHPDLKYGFGNDQGAKIFNDRRYQRGATPIK